MNHQPSCRNMYQLTDVLTRQRHPREKPEQQNASHYHGPKSTKAQLSGNRLSVFTEKFVIMSFDYDRELFWAFGKEIGTRYAKFILTHTT